MSLVKLKMSNGDAVHINVDNVAFVTSSVKDSVPVIGESAVVLINGVPLGIVGTPDEVAQKLNGKENTTHFLST